MAFPFRLLFCALMISCGNLNLHAKIPGNLYVNVNGGMCFNGIASEGTPFSGKIMRLGIAYTPVPDASVGVMIAAGFEINSYRHYFDRSVFVEHIQKGPGIDIAAFLPLGAHVRFTTGIHFFFPYRSVVDMGQKNFNYTYFYSNDSLINRYHRSALNASVIIGVQFALGKNKQTYLGLRFVQAGISPVKKDAVYNDANGETITISRQMKPAGVEVQLLVQLSNRKKSKPED